MNGLKKEWSRFRISEWQKQRGVLMESKPVASLNVTLLSRASLLCLGMILAQVIAWWVHSGAPFAIFERCVAVFFICTGLLLVGWSVFALMAAKA